METDRILDWIALNLLPGLGPIKARRALEAFGSPGAVAHRVRVDDLVRAGCLPASARDEVDRVRPSLRRQAERELRRAERWGIRVIPCVHPDYPAALAEIHDPPLLLYVRGELREGVLRLAMVGSRTPTPGGEILARGLASKLAARGIEVVSGGALGIDTESHRGALAEGGRTVAVLGTGLLEPYPAENEPLFDRIASAGAVVSEFPLHTRSSPGNFPRRNRVISGLSAAVVVVEAARRSGSLITAGHALEQGREVMALPGSVQSHKSAGCNRLIQQGAKLVQNVEDILEELPPLYLTAIGADPANEAAGAPPNLAGLTPDESHVIRILDCTEPVQLDRLAERVPFGVARLQTALFGLEIRGAVEQWPGRYYVLRPKKEP